MWCLTEGVEMFCKCHDKPPKFWGACKEFVDEFVEFIQDPSLDEMSDCCYAVGRIIGAMSGKVYVHVPGDARHIAKIKSRMEEYGCIRSKRHLVNGRCPNA